MPIAYLSRASRLEVGDQILTILLLLETGKHHLGTLFGQRSEKSTGGDGCELYARTA